jgi:DNA-directed RNA polymerase III subunit RPC1
MEFIIILHEVLISLFLQSCSRVLLPDKERKPLLMKVMNPSLPYLVRKALRKQILDKAKKITVCPHCRELNGTVKKCGLLKIVHEKYRSKKSTDPVIVDVLGEFAPFSVYHYSASSVTADHWFVKVCFHLP